MTEQKMLRRRPKKSTKATHLSKILAYAKNHMLFVSRKWRAAEHKSNIDDESYATKDVNMDTIYYLHTDGVYYPIDATLLQRHPTLRHIYSQMPPEKSKPSEHFAYAIRWWIETQDLQIKDIKMKYLRDTNMYTFVDNGYLAKIKYGQTWICDLFQCRNHPVFYDRVYRFKVIPRFINEQDDDDDYYVALRFIIGELMCDMPDDLLNSIIQYLYILYNELKK